MIKLFIAYSASVLLMAVASTSQAADIPMRVVGNFSGNKAQVEGVEKPFFESLAKTHDVPVAVNFNTMDGVGVQAADALRLLRTGAFDVMSVQVGQASRDEPLFEGVDLIGVSTDMAQLRNAVDAYRDVFGKRLESKFNAKVMTLWPFGPQVFFCNTPIKGIESFKGLKVRSFTPSMAAFLQHFGATPVTLQFSEVYPSLQRGVVNCGVTGPTAAHGGKWPEVTTHMMMLSVSGSVQGHFMNLDHWKKYTPEQQGKLIAAFKKMEDQMWDLAVTATADSVNCMTGREPCKSDAKFKMTLVDVAPADVAKVKDAAAKVVLPTWKQTCNKVDPKCSETWNATVGKIAGVKID